MLNLFFLFISFFIIYSDDNLNLKYEAVSKLIIEKNYSEAIKPLEELLKNNPNDDRALNLLGTIYQAINKTDKAEDAFFKALSSNTKNNDARLNLAAIAFKKGHTKKALILYNEALKHDKNNIKALESLAIIMLSMAKYEDAKLFYKRIIDLDKKRAGLNLGLGVIALNELNIKEARLYFLEELKFDKENLDAMFNLALAYEYDLKGNRYADNLDYSKAIDYYDLVLKKNTDFNLAGLNLGIVYAKSKDYKKAIEITKKYKDKKSSFIDKIYYNLACFYSLDNDANNATKYLELAIKNGFKDFDKIKSDPDLDNIRNEEKYKKLIK
jgi:tetratricopeptide (TPR) repeat protein